MEFSFLGKTYNEL